MKSYSVTVNGKLYEITIEEKKLDEKVVEERKCSSVVEPIVKPSSTPKGDVKTTVHEVVLPGDIEIKASIPGKVFKIVGQVGQEVKKGDNIVILEAMKMEIPIVATENGTIATIVVAVGDTIETDDLIATLN